MAHVTTPIASDVSHVTTPIASDVSHVTTPVASDVSHVASYCKTNDGKLQTPPLTPPLKEGRGVAGALGGFIEGFAVRSGTSFSAHFSPLSFATTRNFCNFANQD